MKSVLRVLLFLMAFQVEVTVKAKSPQYRDPSQCLARELNCLFSVKKSVYQYLSADFNLHFTKDALVEKKGLNHFKLLEGVALVQTTAAEFIIETLYGTVTASSGDFWITPGAEGKIVLANVNSKLQVQLRDGQQLILPEGFQFWISGIKGDGKSAYGILEPIEYANLLPSLAKFHKGTKEEFHLTLAKLKLNHKKAVQAGAEIYQEGVDRKIASIQAQQKVLADKKRKENEEKRQLKEEFYRRTFER